jgi:hypothetical protein
MRKQPKFIEKILHKVENKTTLVNRIEHDHQNQRLFYVSTIRIDKF